MGWISDFFVKQKNLEEVRKWVSESKEHDQIRFVLEKFDKFLLERAEKQAEIDRLNTSKSKLLEEFAKISNEKLLFLSSLDYRFLKNSIALAVSHRKKIRAEISELFEPLKELIGQYAQSRGLVKLNSYSQDYVEALIHDYDLSIVKHVPDIIQAVVGGKLLVSNTDILGHVNALKHDRLTMLIHAYAAACKAEERIKLSLSTNPLIKQHENFIKSLTDVQEKIEAINSEIKKIVLPSDIELREELSSILKPHRIILLESNKSG